MDLLIENARLVTMQEGEHGYLPSPPARVGIRSGKIVAISTTEKGKDSAQTESILNPDHYEQTLDLQNRLLLPGLIDCHTHLVYAGNRANEFEMRLNDVPYETIAKQGGGILSTVHATRTATKEQLIESPGLTEQCGKCYCKTNREQPPRGHTRNGTRPR